MPVQHKLLTLLGKTAGLLVIVTIVWFFAGRGYDWLLLKAVNGAGTGQVVIRELDGSLYLYAPPGAERPVAGMSGLGLHYGSALLMVMVLATPFWRLRWKAILLVIGLIAMFILHFTGLIQVMGGVELALRGGEAAAIGTAIDRLLVLSSVVPFALWGLCSLWYWLPRRRAEPASLPPAGRRPGRSRPKAT